MVSVVGGSGFIGTHLASRLVQSDIAVRVVDVSSLGEKEGSVRADVRDCYSLASALRGSEVVYNLAAVHRDDVRPATLYEDVNVRGAANLCNVCRDLGIHKIVFTSSVAVYGFESHNTSEESNTAPVSRYGHSKLRAEQLYRDWHDEDPERRTLVIVRPTVVFGEGNRGNVYELVRQVISRRFVMVGHGRNKKSMAYVGNVSAFLVHVLGLGTGIHVFNYVDEPDLSMEELVRMVRTTVGRSPATRVRIPYPLGYLFGVGCDLVASVCGKRLPISAVRIRKFCSTTTFVAQRLASTGFHPPVSLREALAKTIKDVEVAELMG